MWAVGRVVRGNRILQRFLQEYLLISSFQILPLSLRFTAACAADFGVILC